MSSFNMSSLRSAGSPLRHQTSDKEHDIAHEVLLVALIKLLAKSENGTHAIIDLRQQVESMIGKSNPNSSRIALDLINEAVEQSKN